MGNLYSQARSQDEIRRTFAVDRDTLQAYSCNSRAMMSIGSGSAGRWVTG